jgi:glycosyltransferase involved in cell wall biosynthesis
VRTLNTAKYLSRLDWEVTVVTPNPAFSRCVRDSSGAALLGDDVRRIFTGHGWQVLSREYSKKTFASLVARVCQKVAWYLDIESSIGWLKAAEAACRNLTPDDVDVILATGPPFVTFRLAGRLAKALRRPYVLDYRDPWSGNPHRPVGRWSRPATLDLEQELLNGAAAVTVVSPSWAFALQRGFEVGPKLHVVSNGFDPEELADVAHHDFGHFAIVYTGVFYPPKRVVTPVMAALQHLKKLTPHQQPAWNFHYYGPHGSHVRQEAERHEVMDRIVLHGTVSRSVALSAVRAAGVAVIITSTGDSCMEEDLGIVPAKVFDSVGLGTPILLIAPPRSDVRKIVSKGVGSQSFAGNDPVAIARFLLELMHLGPTRSDCSSGQYAWPVLSGKLNSLLRNVAGKQLVCPAL